MNRYKTINLGRPTREWKKLSGLAIATDNRLVTEPFFVFLKCLLQFQSEKLDDKIAKYSVKSNMRLSFSTLPSLCLESGRLSVKFPLKQNLPGDDTTLCLLSIPNV